LITAGRVTEGMAGLLIAVAAGAAIGACNSGYGLKGAGSATSVRGIQVRGHELVGPSGAPVVLHGVDMSGTEYACAESWSADPFAGQPEDDRRTFAALLSWHINAVRIPLNEDCWLGINGVRIGGAAYRAPVTKLVRDLEGAGLYVILDLHWSAPGTQRALSQNPAPDEDHSPAFWQSVASTFKRDRKVVFDLFNEPDLRWISPGGPDRWTCLWEGCWMTRYFTGGQPSTVIAAWETAGMDQLISVVRKAGAANLILAAGDDSANDLSGWLDHRPADANLAASWHAYPGMDCSSEMCWDQTVAPLAREVPVVVTETGDSSAGPEVYLPSFLPWADAHDLSYLAWTWNAWMAPTNVLVTSMTMGTPTPGEGTEFRDHLLGLG
jgi:hypothetical protein